MTFLLWCRAIMEALGMHVSRMRYAYLSALCASIVLVIGAFLVPASGFPTAAPVAILPGASVTQAGVMLRNKHYVPSAFLFKALVRLMPGTNGVQAGTYAFAHPAGTFTVAWNLSHGISGMPVVRITFPEGTTVRQMGAMLASQLPNFDAARFDEIATPAEGYLFPDTYFFRPDTTEAEAMDTMRANYDSHITPLSGDIALFGKPERDVIIVASLLEGEGRTLDERRMIAGILWRRLALHMPLQVDATFGYIHGASGYTPTASDLKLDSTYNTYRYPGLPPTPIDNPGEDSIRAAITPIKTDYLYYLTGNDGQMHYAKTLLEHVANQKKYLK